MPERKGEENGARLGTAQLEECGKSAHPQPPAQHKLVEMVHACNPGIEKWRQGCQIISCYVSSKISLFYMRDCFKTKPTIKGETEERE